MTNPIFGLAVIFLTGLTLAQDRIEFSGLPQTKISEGGVSRVVDKISKQNAAQYKCIIKTDGDKCYWASRENKEMTKIVSGAFITYIALDGCGFVRIINPEMKNAASMMGDTEATFDYTEHLLMGLKSVSYYGISQ